MRTLIIFATLLLSAKFLLGQSPCFKLNLTKFDYPSLDSMMMLAYQASDFEKAICYMEAGRKKAALEFGQMDSVYTEYTANLGLFYEMSAQYLQAEELYLEVLYIDKKNGHNENIEYANLLNNLAGLYRKMGKYDRVEPLLLECIDVFKKAYGSQHPSYAQSLNSLALLYMNRGKFSNAESLFLEAREIIKNALGVQNSTYTNCLNNLAGLYRKMKKYKDAEKLFEEAMSINSKLVGKEHPIYAQNLNNLAALYVDIKKYEAAEKLFKEALGITQKVLGAMHPDYALSLNNLAALYVAMGNLEAAELLVIEAIAIDKEALGIRHPDYALTLNNLGDLYARFGRFDLAKLNVYQAIQAMCKGCDSTAAQDIQALPNFEFYSLPRILESLNNLQRFAQKQYHNSQDKRFLKEGYIALQAAMQINEKMRNSFDGDQDKLRSLRQMSALAEKAIATGLLLQEEGDIELTTNSFHYAEQNKSVLLADAVKGSKARVLGDLPDSILLKELALQENKKQLEKDEIQAQNSQSKAVIQAKINRLQLEINVFLEKLKEQYPKYHALKYENVTAKVVDIQSLLDDKTMLLEYFVADTVTYLFTITNNSLEIWPIAIKKKVLKKEIRDLRKALSNYQFIVNQKKEAYQLFTHRARLFYETLLKDALDKHAKEAKSTLESLIIIADGELGHLPFEVFLEATPPQEVTDYKALPYLVKKYQVSYDYSATLFTDAKRNFGKNEGLKSQKEDALKAGQMLACAASYDQVNRKKLYEMRPFNLANIRKDLDALPAAQQEIEALSERFKGNFLIKEAANETAFKAQAQQYSIIHLAMHGILDENMPILSSLAFTENGDSLEDNFLQAYEIAHLHLQADLVVLSACETGFGKFEQGEGVISLARSFMYAGTPSLVVSLWQVNDRSTAIIMQTFYEKLSEGMPKDAALRQAKLDYLELADGVAAHPAFWSAFIQLGDSSPIQLKTKSNGLLYWLGGILLLVGIVGFGFKRKN